MRAFSGSTGMWHVFLANASKSPKNERRFPSHAAEREPAFADLRFSSAEFTICDAKSPLGAN